MSKMTSLILLLLLCGTSTLSYAQTKQKEVDLQYKKYKNLKNITVTTAEGTIDFEVSIDMNEGGMPASITLVGTVFNESMARNFVRNLKMERVRKGYQMSTVHNEMLGTLFTTEIFTKGTEYSKYSINEKKDRHKGIINLKEYIIYLEVGDISRQVPEEAENFSF